MDQPLPLPPEVQQQLREIVEQNFSRCFECDSGLESSMWCSKNDGFDRVLESVTAAYRLGLAHGQTPEAEPMNLRIFYDTETRGFYLRGCDGSGSGPTPEDAMRELVRCRNTFATRADQWPVRATGDHP